MSTSKPQFDPDVLLSIHIPKTGGTSLGRVLFDRFDGDLYLDYGYPIRIGNPKTGIQAIHTHNAYREYKDILTTPKVLTFLREPLQRAISHYYYWLGIPLSHNPEPHGEIYIKHFRDQKPDLERFLLSADGWMKNTYTESFLYPLSKPEDFWFMGFVETFDEDIADLRKLFGLRPKKPPLLNKSRKPPLDIPDSVKEEFYRINSRDKAFYEEMLRERNSRKAAIGAWTNDARFKYEGRRYAPPIVRTLVKRLLDR